MGVEPVPEEGVTKKDKTRRSIYVFGSTLLFTALVIGINYFGSVGPVAERTVDGAFGIIELLVIGFLFAGSVDRSEILHNIGKGVRDYGSRRAQQNLPTDGRDPSEIPPRERKDEPVG